MDPGMGSLVSDIHLCGYLRKQKSQHRRYFVLRSASERGPARLEYYENEKKFRAGGLCSRPKRTFLLASALNINKRADARHRHLIVLYGRDGTFGMAAESGEQQERWYAALVELHRKEKEPAMASGAERDETQTSRRINRLNKEVTSGEIIPPESPWQPTASLPGKASLEGDRGTGPPAPAAACKEVWQVSLRPRGLGHTRNLAGIYLLCLTEKTIDFVKLNSEAAVVVLQLLSVRRCGHSENYFFMEVGRSAATGPGELWMQVEDLVVAQNMHETILEAMKALSEDFRGPSRSPSLASPPISVPPRQQQPSRPPASQGPFSWRPRSDGTPCRSRSPVPPGQEALGLRKPDSLSDSSAVSSDEGGSSPGGFRPPGTPDPWSYLVAEGELDYISMGKLASPDGHCLAKWALGAEPHKRASLPPLALEREAPSLPPGKAALRPAAISASYPEGLDRRSTHPGYMAMLPGVAPGTEDQDYVPMTPGSDSPPRERGGYMMMSPSGSCSPDAHSLWEAGGGEGKSLGNDYVNMSPASRSASSTPPEYSPLLAAPSGASPSSFFSLPRSYKHLPPLLASCPCSSAGGPLSCSSSTSSESLGELAGTLERLPLPRGGLEVLAAAPRSPGGEYVSIEYCSRVADYVNLEELGAGPVEPGSPAESAPAARLVRADPQGRRCRRHSSEASPAVATAGRTGAGLNYIDLDLGKEAAPEAAAAPRSFADPSQRGALHTYASIDFHRLGGLHGGKPGVEGTET